MPFGIGSINCRICRYNALKPDMILSEKSFRSTGACYRAGYTHTDRISGDFGVSTIEIEV
ncbi:hypothetical protein IE4803_CH00449 [Rhizobium etli bv. phaseoli str. IE4803]|nr:hypothetical protein IE4803_CH00449 [Rhizobium etli bv. phaseoli str. IE4803]